MNDIERLTQQFEEVQLKEKAAFLAILGEAPLKYQLSDMIIQFQDSQESNSFRLEVDDRMSVTLHFQISTNFMLREKTKEERLLDLNKKAESIINTHKKKICITCNETILPGTEISTIHGFYHGAPKTCVEGR